MVLGIKTERKSRKLLRLLLENLFTRNKKTTTQEETKQEPQKRKDN